MEKTDPLRFTLRLPPNKPARPLKPSHPPQTAYSDIHVTSVNGDQCGNDDQCGASRCHRDENTDRSFDFGAALSTVVRILSRAFCVKALTEARSNEIAESGASKQED